MLRIPGKKAAEEKKVVLVSTPRREGRLRPLLPRVIIAGANPGWERREAECVFMWLGCISGAPLAPKDVQSADRRNLALEAS